MPDVATDSQAHVSTIDLKSRIAARAVIAGVLFALATLTVLMAVAGGLGLWSAGVLDARALARLGAGFAAWAAIALVLSAFCGGFVAAVVSRSHDRRDGLLHGLVTWAAICMTAAVLLCTWFMAALAVGLADADVVGAMDRPGMFWAFVLADLLALGAALAGGRLGASSEGKAIGVRPAPERVPPVRGAFAPTTPSPRPT